MSETRARHQNIHNKRRVEETTQQAVVGRTVDIRDTVVDEVKVDEEAVDVVVGCVVGLVVGNEEEKESGARAAADERLTEKVVNKTKTKSERKMWMGEARNAALRLPAAGASREAADAVVPNIPVAPCVW